MARNMLGPMIGVLVVVSACAPAADPTPASWGEYDTIDALRDDASLVVAGVSQRQTGDGDSALVQFSVTDTLVGTAPDDPLWVQLDRSPLELHPGFHYVLYLNATENDEHFTIVGPGAFERPPGGSTFSRPPGAPETLPASVTVAAITGN
jgi:hypothetical protein